MMRLSEAAAMAGGVLHGADREFSAVGTDSRKTQPGDLFVALQGPRFDGNEYAMAAKTAGAVAAVVSKPVADMPYILVDDARAALGRLAAAWRRRLALKVVGVTGSNGKTTVKEMIAAILGGAGSTWATQGNLNNDIGVPLTLLSLRSEHRYAVVEMGANHPGEIAYVAGLAQPDVAVLNNAGAAHLEASAAWKAWRAPRAK
nr:UDP-N-acetylmuramoyl-tripeptide--D-alanyl-D-alanine ligase [Methylogaea oryzae]